MFCSLHHACRVHAAEIYPVCVLTITLRNVWACVMISMRCQAEWSCRCTKAKQQTWVFSAARDSGLGKSLVCPLKNSLLFQGIFRFEPWRPKYLREYMKKSKKISTKSHLNATLSSGLSEKCGQQRNSEDTHKFHQEDQFYIWPWHATQIEMFLLYRQENIRIYMTFAHSGFKLVIENKRTQSTYKVNDVMRSEQETGARHSCRVLGNLLRHVQ